LLHASIIRVEKRQDQIVWKLVILSLCREMTSIAGELCGACEAGCVPVCSLSLLYSQTSAFASEVLQMIFNLKEKLAEKMLNTQECVRTHTHTHARRHAHTHTRTHAGTHTHTRASTQAHPRKHTLALLYLLVALYSRCTPECVCLCVYMLVPLCVCVCVCVCVYRAMRAHTEGFTWVEWGGGSSGALTRGVSLSRVCARVCVLGQLYRPVDLEHTQVLLVQRNVSPEHDCGGNTERTITFTSSSSSSLLPPYYSSLLLPISSNQSLQDHEGSSSPPQQQTVPVAAPVRQVTSAVTLLEQRD